MKKLITILVSVIILAVASLSIGAATVVPEKQIYGVWTHRNEGQHITQNMSFYDNGTYRVENYADGEKDIHGWFAGYYSFEGTVITRTIEESSAAYSANDITVIGGNGEHPILQIGNSKYEYVGETESDAPEFSTSREKALSETEETEKDTEIDINKDGKKRDSDLWDIKDLNNSSNRELISLGDYFLYFPNTWDVKRPIKRNDWEYIYPSNAYDSNGNVQAFFMDNGILSTSVEDTPEMYAKYYDVFIKSFGESASATIEKNEDITLFDTPCRRTYFTQRLESGVFDGILTVYKDGPWDYVFCLMQRQDCPIDYTNVYDYMLKTAKMSEISAQLEAESKFAVNAGTHHVGSDMQAGEYILFSSSSSGYFCVSSDSNGTNIIFNDNFKYNSIISVRDGEYVKLDNCTAFPIDKNIRTVDVTEPGMFKVGLHIPAGTYNIVVENGEDSGYYCIYSSSRQDDIISNDIFSTNAIVTVTDGEYLKLSGAVFETPPEVPEKTYSDENTIKSVQEALNGKGYDCGTADGIAGEKTKNQILQYQTDNDLEATGTINDALLASLGLK